MKVYSKRLHRYVERKVHFGIGGGTKTVCGVVLFSRNVIVSVFSSSSGELITDSVGKVTCKRCLAVRETRLRKLIAIESVAPGVFDRDTLCGEQWLLEHGLDVNKDMIDAQQIELGSVEERVTLTNRVAAKDRRWILRNYVGAKSRLTRLRG